MLDANERHALLESLTRFYASEARGLPHRDEDLWETAWLLAELMSELPGIYNAGRLDTDEADEILDDPARFRERLVREHTTVLIDTAVNLLHHALVEMLDDDAREALDVLFAEDIRDYLLHRNDPNLMEELEAEKAAIEAADRW